MRPIHFLLLLELFLGYASVTSAHLNLYMNSTETRRLLGITAELFYVRNGVINDYALSFNLPIKPEFSDVYFTWQSLRQSPPEPAMFYSLSITVSNDNALGPPIANIPSEGEVPTQLSVFRITFPCNVDVTAQVDVVILMEVGLYSASNRTTLEIRRKKMCLKHDMHNFDPRNRVHTDPDGRYDNLNFTFLGKGDDALLDAKATTSTNIFYIAVGCACAVILLVALIVAVYYVRSQKSSNERLSETSSSKGLTQPPQHFLRPETPSVASSMPTIRPGPSISELKPSEVRNLLGEIHLERSRITLTEVLIEGTFGRIYRGTLAVGEDDLDEQDVLVKTVTDAARKDQIETLMREGCLLKSLGHQNLCPVVASCLDNDLQPLLIYNLANESNLKKFLQRCNIADVGSPQALSTQQIVYMAIQIARGIQYLHRRRIIHKDIATRNCVVDGQLQVKVTDNALSRDLFPGDYHCLGDNENRPVKWQAVEALLERRFSLASDVWSFGVTLWELVTIGQQPYADIDPFEMSGYLKQGYRAQQPPHCPDEVFAVMACCWAMMPEERPKMAQLQLCLQDFYTALCRYV